MITSLIRSNKSECAKKRHRLVEDLRRLKENNEYCDGPFPSFDGDGYPHRPAYAEWAPYYVLRYEERKRDFHGSRVTGHTNALVLRFEREILSDLGLISGKVRKEVLYDGSNRQEFAKAGWHGYISDWHQCPVPHFATDVSCRYLGVCTGKVLKCCWLLSPTVSAGGFSRCLQKYDVDTSPYLKSFLFDNERPGMLMRPKMPGGA